MSDGFKRDKAGWFGKGNKGGPGSSTALKVNRLRSEWLDCVTEQDMVDCYARLMTLVNSGEISAIREYLDRALGKATQPVEHSGEITAGTKWNLDKLTESQLLALKDVALAAGVTLIPNDQPRK